VAATNGANGNMRTCPRCKIKKSIEEFALNSSSTNGRQSYCRSCNTELVRIWREKNPEKLKAQMKRSYKPSYLKFISPDQYQEMLDRQDGRCEICKEKGEGLIVDTDRNFGYVRGLLCFRCNTLVGYIEKTPHLEIALEYIQKYAP
jgi:Recombination endonuclease VII